MTSLLTLTHQKEHEHNGNDSKTYSKKGDFYFASLISSTLFLLAEINLTILWHDLPGQIIDQGDIDNKLKTLFDALSCPPHESQITGLKPESGEEPFFCLLEKDRSYVREEHGENIIHAFLAQLDELIYAL